MKRIQNFYISFIITLFIGIIIVDVLFFIIAILLFILSPSVFMILWAIFLFVHVVLITLFIVGLERADKDGLTISQIMKSKIDIWEKPVHLKCSKDINKNIDARLKKGMDDNE